MFYFIDKQKSDEEQWSLKQKLNSFDVEKMSFQKEKEYQRSQMSIEQQRVQVSDNVYNIFYFNLIVFFRN